MKIFFILGLILISNANASLPSAVFVHGSLHTAMLNHPQYTLPVFMGILDLYKPDLVLTEVRPENPGPEDGSIDGGIEQSIVYAMANARGFEVQPVDWFTTKWIERSIREQERYEKSPINEIEKLAAEYGQHFQTDDVISLHSSVVRVIVQKMYDLLFANGYTSPEKRNEHICKNVTAALNAASGKRVLIMFGLDHKFYLERCLERLAIPVLGIEDWLSVEDLTRYKVDSRVVSSSIINIRNSEQLLRQRLRDGYYQSPLKERLEQKLQSFPLGAEKLEEL